MVEERLVAGAQVIQPGLAIGRECEPVARALAVAGETHLTLPTVPRQRVALGLAEGSLLVGGDQLQEMGLLNIAEKVLGLDEVIAGVQIAVVFERQRIATRLSEDAERAADADPRPKRGVEHLDEDLGDVLPDPLVEDGDQEAAPLVGPHRSFRNQFPFEKVERPRLVRVAPALVGQREQFGGRSFDDRDELHELGAEVVTEEAVHLEPVISVGGMDGTQDVEIDGMRLQEAEPAHHPVEGTGAALVEAVGVMERLGSVETDAHQETVLLEEATPFVVQRGAVGLDRVLDRLPRTPVLLDELDRAAEEVQPHEGRLAALPGEVHFRCLMGLEQLADVVLEQVVRHAEAAAGVEHLLGEEEAVLAVEVADRAGRFHENVKGGRRAGGAGGGNRCGLGHGHGIDLRSAIIWHRLDSTVRLHVPQAAPHLHFAAARHTCPAVSHPAKSPGRIERKGAGPDGVQVSAKDRPRDDTPSLSSQATAKRGEGSAFPLCLTCLAGCTSRSLGRRAASG